MSLTTLVAGIRTACEGITGIVGVDTGEPEPLPTDTAQYPRLVIEVGPSTILQQTFGTTGAQIEFGHQGTLRLLLGPNATRPQEAIKRLIPLVDRLREAWYADLTFAGACRDSALSAPVDNLSSYRKSGKAKLLPEARWRWAAMEETTTGATAL
jgi:hypothetical protein